MLLLLLVVVLLLAAGAGATMASKRTAERPAACPFAAFTKSVGSMRDWVLAMV